MFSDTCGLRFAPYGIMECDICKRKLMRAVGRSETLAVSFGLQCTRKDYVDVYLNMYIYIYIYTLLQCVSFV